jgi:hypothetical protein
MFDKFMGKHSLSFQPHPALPLKAGLDAHLAQGSDIIALNDMIFLLLWIPDCAGIKQHIDYSTKLM